MMVLVHAVSTIVLVLVLLVLDIQSALIGGCTIIQSINRLQSIDQLIELIIHSAQSCIFFTVTSRLSVLVDIVVELAVDVRNVNFSIRVYIIRV